MRFGHGGKRTKSAHNNNNHNAWLRVNTPEHDPPSATLISTTA